MDIEIEDDFDLDKIIESGQCFRAARLSDGRYRFITGNAAVYIRDMGGGAFCASCTEDEWRRVWAGYFDMGRCYAKVRGACAGKNPFIDRAAEAGRGLRILRQDPWEMLISFIISQRKSIPAIARSIELLAGMCGRELWTGEEIVHAFPTVDEMSDITADDLKRCGMGYRIPYILDAVRIVGDGLLDLSGIASLNTPELLEELRRVHGVGKKVANCVALFAYGRTDCVPIDVWIARAIEEECGGQDPFPAYGEHAGIMQQYVFYYQKHA